MFRIPVFPGYKELARCEARSPLKLLSRTGTLRVLCPLVLPTREERISILVDKIKNVCKRQTCGQVTLNPVENARSRRCTARQAIGKTVSKLADRLSHFRMPGFLLTEKRLVKIRKAYELNGGLPTNNGFLKAFNEAYKKFGVWVGVDEFSREFIRYIKGGTYNAHINFVRSYVFAARALHKHFKNFKKAAFCKKGQLGAKLIEVGGITIGYVASVGISCGKRLIEAGVALQHKAVKRLADKNKLTSREHKLLDLARHSEPMYKDGLNINRYEYQKGLLSTYTKKDDGVYRNNVGEVADSTKWGGSGTQRLEQSFKTEQDIRDFLDRDARMDREYDLGISRPTMGWEAFEEALEEFNAMTECNDYVIRYR